MKVRFHSVNFTADIKLLNFVQTKLNKLDVFCDRIVGADAYFKVEPMSDKGNKLVEIKLKVPGKELMVKKTDIYHSLTFSSYLFLFELARFQYNIFQPSGGL